MTDEPPSIACRRFPAGRSSTWDGIWCAFATAYFPDLPPVLASWKRLLKPDAWIALLEIDDLFGHEPLSARSRALFEAAVESFTTLPNDEFSFDGPASDATLASWRARFARMPLLQSFCGVLITP